LRFASLWTLLKRVGFHSRRAPVRFQESGETERPPERIRGVRFGEFAIDLHQRELRRQGVKVKINERPFQVLSLLVARAGEVVSREEFQRAIWPSDANVDFNANLNTALNSLRRVLGDTPQEAIYIKTVPRQGYRLIPPAVPIEDELDSVETVRELPGTPAKEASTRKEQAVGRLVPVFSLLLLVTGAASWRMYASHRRRPAQTAAPVLAVPILIMPFDYLGEGPRQDDLTEGMSREIIARLGQRLPERLDATAGTGALQDKNANRSLEEIARQERVSYILEGTYQRQGQHVHITAELYGADQRAILWADSYDREGEDVVATQIDVASLIVKSILPELLR